MLSRGRHEVTVPQRTYTSHHQQLKYIGPKNPIAFPSRSGLDGIALINVLGKNFNDLVGRDDPMFEGYSESSTVLRIEWPGYKSWKRMIATRKWTRDREPIKKSKLAFEVAKGVKQFIRQNVNEPITFGEERWKVGPGFIEVEDLVLVRFVQVSGASWQAELRVFE
ncbi:hypothetical protein BDM02DRAFT_3146956, partial [Thelephora ganbajun]